MVQEHWFTLRKISEEWWNLNSLLPAPQYLSDTYLSLFLAQLREEGYSIFVVQGMLPSGTQDDGPAEDAPGTWYTPEQVRCVFDKYNAQQHGSVRMRWPSWEL